MNEDVDGGEQEKGDKAKAAKMKNSEDGDTPSKEQRDVSPERW